MHDGNGNACCDDGQDGNGKLRTTMVIMVMWDFVTVTRVGIAAIKTS